MTKLILKLGFLFFALIAVFLFSCVSHAQSQVVDAGEFSLRIPANWVVAAKNENEIALSSQDKKCFVTVTLNYSVDLSFRAYIRAMGKIYNVKPVKIKDNLYSYTIINKENLPETVLMGEVYKDDTYYVISITGDLENKGVEAIIDSLAFK
jgi:hypothetical protein